MIDAERAHMMGLIGGALVGAAIGASISSDSRVIGAGANSGALHGGLGASGRALSRQQVVMGNCMASRGYRVIDGTAMVSYNMPMQAPTPAPAAAPMTQATASPAGALTPASSVAPAALAPQPAQEPGRLLTLREGGTPTLPEPTGKDSYMAERVAREQKCNSTDVAKLIGRGPGFESYSFKCTNSDMLIVRCEMGSCKALK
jgi:hypothetical protein